MFSTDDTIVAIATPPGRGGIGVVRVSGPDAAAIARALTGRGEWRSRRATRLQGGERRASPRDVRDGLGPSFAWRGSFALGVLLPAAGDAGWAAERPQLFGLLAAAESLVRRRPVFRGLGAFTVLEGVRR